MMNDDQLGHLFTLVHDKGHVVQPGETNLRVDTLFTPDTMTKMGTSLWRGLCDEDLKLLETMHQRGYMFKTYPGYMSMTENLSIAKRFSRAYKTKNIMQVIKTRTKPAQGISLPHLFDNIHDITENEKEVAEIVKKEKEWIFRKPRIIIKSVFQRDDYTIWRVKLVTI